MYTFFINILMDATRKQIICLTTISFLFFLIYDVLRKCLHFIKACPLIDFSLDI